MVKLLKLIGIGLFILILLRIDAAALTQTIKAADPLLLIFALVLQFIIYVIKTWRWHVLVHMTELKPRFADSWQLYNIGIFLAIITPAKLGELGKAAYLKQAGVHTGTALGITIADKIVDMLVIGMIAVIGVGILFGPVWFFATGGVVLLGCIIMLLSSQQIVRMAQEKQWLGFMRDLLHPKQTLALIAITALSWTVYFTWGFLIARSVGIPVPFLTMVAAFTITGIVALVPIAPSGLGTRDAALLTLLTPYGVTAAQSVSLSLLMFLSIVLSSLLGGWYWMCRKD